MPSYEWLKGTIDAVSGDDLQQQYKEFCEASGRPYHGDLSFQETKFVYNPPPENLSLSVMSPNTCDTRVVPGSVRALPQVPIEVPWRSVQDYSPPASKTLVASPQEQIQERVADAARQQARFNQEQAELDLEIVSGRGCTAPRESQPAEFVSGVRLGYDPQTGLGGGDSTRQLIRGFAEESTMPNIFQIRAGQWEQTRPSATGNNGPPFTGVFNVLSQVYDPNTSLDELMPELRDQRFFPSDPEEEPDELVQSMINKPDQLTASSNRYTHIMGVQKDPITGGYIVEYGQDFSIDYKGKVYDTPPTTNLGAANPYLDRLLNFGTYPNQRGSMLTQQKQTNDVSPAKPFTAGYLNNAQREYAQQMGGRQLVNAYRSENLQPIDSRANANNPANAYAQYGNVGARSLATTGNILKLTNPDIFEPVLRDQPNQMASNFFGQQTKHGARDMNTFVREGETYDVSAITTHSFPIATKSSTVSAIDPQGFSATQTYTDAQSLAPAQRNTALQHQVDAQGFTNANTIVADYVTGKNASSLASSQIDASGFTHTSVAPMESLRALQPAQAQVLSPGVDAQGFTVAQMLASTRPQQVQQKQFPTEQFDPQGYTQTSTILSKYSAQLGVSPAQNVAYGIDAYGMGANANVQHSARMQQQNIRASPVDQVDAQGMTLSHTLDTAKMQRASAMAPQNANHAVDAQGLTQTSQIVQQPTGLSQHMMNAPQTAAVGVDATGFTTTGLLDTFVTGTAKSYAQNQPQIDARGMTDESQTNLYAYNFNVNALSGSDVMNASKQVSMGIRDTALPTDSTAMSNQEQIRKVLVEHGPMQFSFPDVKDSTAQMLNPLAVDLSSFGHAAIGFSSAVKATQLQARQQAGQGAYTAALAKEFQQGVPDVARLGVMEYTQDWSDTSSNSEQRNLNYGFGTRMQ